MRRLAVLSALLIPAALSAQANPLIGSWSATIPAGAKMENGEVTPLFASGTITVRAEGDSLIAMVKVDSSEGRPPRPASRLAAKATSGAVTFIAKGEAKVNINGEESTHASVSTYVLEATGDTLKGTLKREIEGMDMGMNETQPITGKRVK